MARHEEKHTHNWTAVHGALESKFMSRQFGPLTAHWADWDTCPVKGALLVNRVICAYRISKNAISDQNVKHKPQRCQSPELHVRNMSRQNAQDLGDFRRSKCSETDVALVRNSGHHLLWDLHLEALRLAHRWRSGLLLFRRHRHRTSTATFLPMMHHNLRGPSFLASTWWPIRSHTLLKGNINIHGGPEPNNIINTWKGDSSLNIAASEAKFIPVGSSMW